MSALRIARRGVPAELIPDPDCYAGLTSHQLRVIEVLLAHRGNRSRAARQLGVTVQSVQATVRVIARRGAPLPPIARRGPDLRARRRAP